MMVEAVWTIDCDPPGVVQVVPHLPVPNGESWDSFSAAVDIVCPAGERRRCRARFGKMHPHFAKGARKESDGPLPFWTVTITLNGIHADDVPAGSVIYADEAVVAKLQLPRKPDTDAC